MIGWTALRDEVTRVARLAALDSTLCDQYGCLSMRIHFVERDGRHTSTDFGADPGDAMRRLADRLSRGGGAPAPSPSRMRRLRAVGAGGRCGCVLTD